MMFELKKIFYKSLFTWLLAIFPYSVSGQIAGCSLAIPPFISSGVEVTNILGQNTSVLNDITPWPLCLDSNFIIPDTNAFISLGLSSNLWSPFIYNLHFSKPIYSFQLVIYVSGTGIPNVDYGAENFIFETNEGNIDIESLFACNEFIDGDTLFLGYNTLNYGDGIFKISFDCPVYSLSISGKGGGNGSRMLICQNSLTTPNLWGKVFGDSILTSPQDSIFFNAFGGVAPYTFSYTVNGGAVQTLVSNTPQAWLPAPSSNGTYAYNLLQVQDGNDSIAVIACNGAYVAVVNLASTAELELLNFSFSPNPAKEELYISASNYIEENTDIQITDMEGRIVLETKYQPGKALDISGLKSGLYFLRIESEKGWVAKRFVKL
jgi:hypothetical protein